MKWNRIAGIILFIIVFISLIFSIWPVSDHIINIPFEIPGGIAGKLELIYPYGAHVGETTEISLHIVMNQKPLENQPVTYISKLEMDNVEVSPRGEGKVTIDQFKPLMLKWKVTPHKPGFYTGTLWLFTESSNSGKNLVLARLVEIQAQNFLGFSYQLARIICGLGMVTAIILYFFPNNAKKSG